MPVLSFISRFRRWAFTLTIAALPLLAPSTTQSQPPPTLSAAAADSFARAARARPRPVASATITSETITIDANLNEAAWATSTPVSEFIQRELNEGVPASERTEVRFLSDGIYLYVGARMFDREPRLIVPGEKIRDGTLGNSDYVAIILDTYHDRQNGFVFATTPAGIEYDGQVIREGEGGGVFTAGQNRSQAGALGGFNVNWDASWTVATRTDSLGWIAEFRIPFSTLRYAGGGDQTWGLNIARSIRRKNEELFWSFIPRQFNIYRLSLAGELKGLTVPQRRIQTVTPYVLSSAQQRWPAAPEPLKAINKYPAEFGADAKFGITPALTLDLTYNTDFAQVEVDDQRINLTRFPVFFPEKRPFFLENAGTFSAGTPQAADLFFSRRIGISNGVQQPIIGGGRLSGRVGGTTIGLLQMVTDEPDGGGDGQSYTVARGIRELSARSRVGGIFVQRMNTSDTDDANRTYALDGRLGLGQSWTIDAWGARTETPGKPGDDLAASARAAYQTRVWNNSARVLQVGGDFNPEVGFVSRPAGYRQYQLTGMRFFRRPEWSWFKQWNPHVNFTETRGIEDDFVQSRSWHIDATEIELASSTRFGPEWNIATEGLQAPFEISPGVIIPVGTYTWGGLGFDFTTDASRNFSVTGRADFGDFWTGTRKGGNATFTFRQGATFSSSFLIDYNSVKLPQGDFDRSLTAVRLNYFFTPRIFVQTLTQFNNQQEIWGANVRFGWLNTAGTGLFIVFNDGREATGFFDWVRPQQRTLFVKFTRQFGTGG